MFKKKEYITTEERILYNNSDSNSIEKNTLLLFKEILRLVKMDNKKYVKKYERNKFSDGGVLNIDFHKLNVENVRNLDLKNKMEELASQNILVFQRTEFLIDVNKLLEIFNFAGIVGKRLKTFAGDEEIMEDSFFYVIDRFESQKQLQQITEENYKTK